MIFKTTLNYSPNFSLKKRDSKKVKFLIFHYTGMKKETEAINRLTDIKSKVSSHYFIKNNGEIITMVPEPYIAWHAGVSFWKNFSSLNKNSIGIEIHNSGHDFQYKKFSKKQINSILLLSKSLIKKYKIKPQNILGHSDIAPNRKKDPGEKFPWRYLANRRIGIWHKIKEKELKKIRNKNITKTEMLKFIRYLSKIGYFVKNLNKNSKFKLVKSFQRRFRQNLINGKIDRECLVISKNLVKS